MKIREYMKELEESLKPNALDLSQYKVSSSSRDAINVFADKLSEATAWLKQYESLLVIVRAMQKIYKEIQEADSLSQEELEERYSKGVEISDNIGKQGWVITGRLNSDYVSEWSQLLSQSDNEGVVEYFEGDHSDILKDIVSTLQDSYAYAPENLYFSEGIKSFYDGEYTASAMFLLGLLDYRFNVLVDFPTPDKGKHLKVSEKFSEEGVSKQKKADFITLTDGKSIMKKVVCFTEWYPSLIAYMTRTFIDGDYKFELDNEPPYLNRNWLMHGRMKRKVERYECIQLLNALDMVEMMFNKDYAPNT